MNGRASNKKNNESINETLPPGRKSVFQAVREDGENIRGLTKKCEHLEKKLKKVETILKSEIKGFRNEIAAQVLKCLNGTAEEDEAELDQEETPKKKKCRFTPPTNTTSKKRSRSIPKKDTKPNPHLINQEEQGFTNSEEEENEIVVDEPAQKQLMATS